MHNLGKQMIAVLIQNFQIRREDLQIFWGGVSKKKDEEPCYITTNINPI